MKEFSSITLLDVNIVFVAPEDCNDNPLIEILRATLLLPKFTTCKTSRVLKRKKKRTSHEIIDGDEVVYLQNEHQLTVASMNTD